MARVSVSQPSFDLRGHCQRCAIVGLAAWVWALFLVRWTSWAEAIVVLGALVVTPVVLALLPPRDSGSVEGRAWQAAVWLQLPAALLLLPAFTLPPGLFAGALTLPGLICTGLVAVVGLDRLRSWRPHGAGEIGLHLGLAYLAVGGGWLILSRLGATPLGFQEPIILLTAGHFHFAGLVLPILTGLAAGARPSRLGRAITLAVVAGVPLVAVGITARHFWPGLGAVEAATAWFLSAACLGVVWLQLRLASRFDSRPARVLLIVSALSLLAGSVLSILYAVGHVWGPGWLDIPTMIRTHAVLNGVGFAAGGLLAWTIRGERGV